MQFGQGATWLSQVLEQPAAEYSFKICLGERDLIGIAQMYIDSLRAVMVDQIRGVIHCDDVVHVLLCKPATPRSKIQYRFLTDKSLTIPESTVNHLQIPDDPRSCSKNVVPVGLPRLCQRFNTMRHYLTSTKTTRRAPRSICPPLVRRAFEFQL